MGDSLERRVCRLCGASAVVGRERIGTVWSGYGELLRLSLAGAEVPAVVVKVVRPGKGWGRGHQRKLRSYGVEQRFYDQFAGRCGTGCRVARCFEAARAEGGWTFVLEDLDAAGFPRRHDAPPARGLNACLRWLAAFHAAFLGEAPDGLWKTGTYWHLATRPDELRAMAPGPLRRAAPAIDARLNSARFSTLVHGDAKPENFCFSRDGRAVAAVDFQYVGGGVGVKDVAYLLAAEPAGVVEQGLELYFRSLGKILGAERSKAVEREWRALYPLAWADFHRFLAGWHPGWRFLPHEKRLTEQALRAVAR